MDNSESSDSEENTGPLMTAQASQVLKKIADESDGGTSFAMQEWKKRSETTYETLVLAKTQFNCKVKGAGFRKNGKMRTIKKNVLLAKMKTRCRLRKAPPKLAMCLTMYNEDTVELKNTLRGLIHNYNTFRADPAYKGKFSKDDFLIFIVVDGYDALTEDFKKFAREKGFLDEEEAVARKLMTRKVVEDERTGEQRNQYKMRPIEEIMEKHVKEKEIPQNLLHVW